MSFERYVGVPYVDKGRDLAGLDCWGLVWIVNRERGVDLPGYDGRYSLEADRHAIARLIEGEIAADWDEIPTGSERAFDCVLMRDGRVHRHVGVVVAPDRVLHVQEGKTSVIERYRSGPLKDHVVGFYRYRR